MREGLFLVFLDFHWLEVFGLEDLTAVQAFYIVDTVSPGNHLGAGMVTNGLHNQRLDRFYSNRVRMVVKPPSDTGYNPG
jgi:hypothetical protein